MRIPWRIIRLNSLWIILSTIGFLFVCLNFTDVYHTPVIPKLRLVQQLQPDVKIHHYETKFELDRELGNAKEIHSDQPIQHIAFLKVHKAASSTAQNIFLRYGWNNNLTFVLSPAKNQFGYPNIISLRESLTNSNILPPPPQKHYDILCNHVFYTKEGFSNFMPKDAVYIGIIREPFELYKSILNYFRPRYIFNKIGGISPGSEFLRNPQKFEPKGRISNSWTNNRMAVEFGFPQSLFSVYNQTLVDNYLQKLDEEFRLVLIAEHLEESVVLMRRMLNWKTKDILFLNLNVARKKNDTMLSQALDRDFYHRYARVDYALYTFFYKRLKRQIREEGDDFEEELLEFIELRKRAQEYCLQTSMEAPLPVDPTKWSEGFEITRGDCNDMKRGEISFVTMIRVRQYGSKDI